MKKLLILVLLLFVPFAYARGVDIILHEHESYMEEGINITLMNIDKNKEKFIICVNNEQTIVTEEGVSNKDFVLDVDYIDKDKIRVDIDVDRDCKKEDCECTGYCYNKRCFPNPKYIPRVPETNDVEPEPQDVIEEDIEVGNYAFIIFLILFVVIILIAYYVVKKKI